MKSLRVNIFIIISLLYILYVVVPIVQTYVSGLEAVINIGAFVILYLAYPTAFNTDVTRWFLLYMGLIAAYVLFNRPLTIGIGTVADNKKIFIEAGFFLPSFAISSILFHLKDVRLYKIISYSGLGMLVFSFLYMIPLLLSNGVIMRDAHVLLVETNTLTPGIPIYTLMHAYLIILPAVLFGVLKLKGLRKVILYLLLFLLLFIILHTYVTTSILITVIILIISLLYNPENILRSMVIIVFALLLVYLMNSTGFFIKVFDFLLLYFEGTAVEPKIESFKYIYEYGDVANSGDHITGRMNYHEMSLHAFSENYLIGGTSPVGGHSSLLDRLGGMGLLVFIPFFMLLWSLYKMQLHLFPKSAEKMYYIMGWITAGTVLYQKGLFGQEGWLFLIVLFPSLIFAFSQSSGKTPVQYTSEKI